MSQFEELKGLLEEKWRMVLQFARVSSVNERIDLKCTLNGVRAGELAKHTTWNLTSLSSAGAVTAAVACYTCMRDVVVLCSIRICQCVCVLTDYKVGERR